MFFHVCYLLKFWCLLNGQSYFWNSHWILKYLFFRNQKAYLNTVHYVKCLWHSPQFSQCGLQCYVVITFLLVVKVFADKKHTSRSKFPCSVWFRNYKTANDKNACLWINKLRWFFLYLLIEKQMANFYLSNCEMKFH